LKKGSEESSLGDISYLIDKAGTKLTLFPQLVGLVSEAIASDTIQ
jgi:hypothetical protein